MKGMAIGSCFFCDDDDDDYTVNHIYLDNDGDVCLESTDTEGDNYDFTANNVLNRLKHYENDKYVYFLEEYLDGSSNDYDIVFNWYIGYDEDGDSILNIDCKQCEEYDWYSGGYNRQNNSRQDNNRRNRRNNRNRVKQKQNDDYWHYGDPSTWDCWGTQESLDKAIKDWYDTIDREGHL